MLTRLVYMAGLWSFALLLGAALPTAAAPGRDATAKGEDCAACHRADKPLPAGHKATLSMRLADCLECHGKKSKNTLSGKLPGSHLHQLAGVSCAACHGSTGKPAPVEMAQCMSCHGSGEEVAKLTGKMKPQNPHVSVHYNSDLDCNVCHHQHARSEDFCSQCHSFNFTVP